MIGKRENPIPTYRNSIFIVFVIVLSALCHSLVAVSQPAAEQAPAKGQTYVAGTHYDVLDVPVRTRDGSKVEVVEVFWYGCSHCYRFESIVERWKKKQGDDVDFWRSPAMWNDTMKLHAKAFYTAKALGVWDKLHTPIFTTLIVEGKRLGNKSQIEDLFADYGVDRKKFNKAFDSFGINSQVTQADARARSYKISGTPEVVVNGKYRVSAKAAGGQPQMLNVIDYLVAKERALLAAK